eukprot:CFRG5638T1
MSVSNNEANVHEAPFSVYEITTDSDVYYDNDVVRCQVVVQLGPDSPLGGIYTALIASMIIRNSRAKRMFHREVYREIQSLPMDFLNTRMTTCSRSFTVPMFGGPTLRSRKMIRMPSGAISADIELKWEVVLVGTMAYAQERENENTNGDPDQFSVETVVLASKPIVKRTLYDGVSEFTIVEGYSFRKVLMGKDKRNQMKAEDQLAKVSRERHLAQAVRSPGEVELTSSETDKNFLYEQELYNMSNTGNSSFVSKKQFTGASIDPSVPKKHLLMRASAPGLVANNKPFKMAVTIQSDVRVLQPKTIKAYLRQNVTYMHDENTPVRWSSVVAYRKVKPKIYLVTNHPVSQTFTLSLDIAQYRYGNDFLNFTGAGTKSNLPVPTCSVTSKLNQTLFTVEYAIETHCHVLGGIPIVTSVPVVVESECMSGVHDFVNNNNRVSVLDRPVRDPTPGQAAFATDEVSDESADEESAFETLATPELQRRRAYTSPQVLSTHGVEEAESHVVASTSGHQRVPLPQIGVAPVDVPAYSELNQTSTRTIVNIARGGKVEKNEKPAKNKERSTSRADKRAYMVNAQSERRGTNKPSMSKRYIFGMLRGKSSHRNQIAPVPMVEDIEDIEEPPHYSVLERD